MTSILDISKTYLKRVKPSGNENIMAICPFHRKSDGREEMGPSFSMNVYSGLWFCHSCHARGNLYTFLRTVGIPHSHIITQYQYALDEAATHGPPAPDPLNPVEPTTEPLGEGLLGLFDYYPALMQEEGYSPELCRHFGVGFDEKHQRVTFPLRDMSGRLIGISGRATTEHQYPRYKVYDTEYQDFGLPFRRTEKRALLWNAHEVLIELAQTPRFDRFVVIVEGFKACMRVLDAGISTVVALLGSHLSKEQQWFLEKLGVRLYLMLDNNEAGRDGTLKAAEHLLGHAELYVMDYNTPQPSDLAPDDVLASVFSAKPFAVWFNQQLATS